MMPVPIYEKGHPVDCDVPPALTTLKNKSVLVTGGLPSKIGHGHVLGLTLRRKGPMA